MKPTCGVIKDLLPLYTENIVSNDTRLMVDEHLDSCADCRNELAEMQKQIKLPPDTNLNSFHKVQKKLFAKKVQTILFSVLLTTLVAIVAIAYMTAPSYLPYSDYRVSVSRTDGETVLATFSEEVSGYYLSQYESEDGSGYVYHITTWHSFWDQHVQKSRAEKAVLNPDMENVVAVYYYSTDGSEDILIYGDDIYRGGGVITLPRLFLTYYALFALFLTILAGIALGIFRKSERLRNALEKIILLPVSYLAGSLLIVGPQTSSYSAQRDFFAIILVMLPVYCILSLAVCSYRRLKRIHEG